MYLGGLGFTFFCSGTKCACAEVPSRGAISKNTWKFQMLLSLPKQGRTLQIKREPYIQHQIKL